jgi:hypothetical protein
MKGKHIAIKAIKEIGNPVAGNARADYFERSSADCVLERVTHQRNVPAGFVSLFSKGIAEEDYPHLSCPG